jgi:3-oxoacyl-[acyl-carrier protein] reductase
MDLRGTVAVVTGGGTGIGAAVCERLAESGAAGVVVNYARSAEAAEATAIAVRDRGCSAEPVRADIADDEQARELAARAVERFGRVDILVNNAGTTRGVPFEDLEALTEEVWRELLDVNLLGAFYCTRALAAQLRAARGAVVNVASIAAHRAVGSSIAYGVSKAALIQLTRGLAVALAPQVRVNSVSPGTVASRWHIDRLGLGEEGFAELTRSEREHIPLGRTTEPRHVADAVAALLTADLVTGESLVIDGGKHLRY